MPTPQAPTSQDKFHLLETVVPNRTFAVPVRGFVLSSSAQAEIDKIQPGFAWDKAPSVLLQQDAQGDDVECHLTRLAKLLPTAA